MKQTYLKTLSARIDELEQLRILNGLSFEEFTRLALDANKQSKTIVTLAHFVPCDKNGVPLLAIDDIIEYSELLKAHDDVIFCGFTYVGIENGAYRLKDEDGVIYSFFGKIVYRNDATLKSLADLAAATTKNPLKLK